jgi:fluoride exporter
MARYWCSGFIAWLVGETLPWGTLVINVLGSCGGCTTFSSFSLQTLNLVNDGGWLPAGTNIFLSVVLCLFAVSIGYALAGVVNSTKWMQP